MAVSPGVLILAAGQGARMKSTLPKVLHEIGGQSLIFHTLDRIREALPRSPIAVVVGIGRNEVEGAISANPAFTSMDLTFVHQTEQKGTGHAARCAMDGEWGARMIAARAPVLVLPGDLPLLSAGLIGQMAESLARGDALRLLTCEFTKPAGYGRVVRRGRRGRVLRIVEEKDATVREKAINEVAASIYLFNPVFLRSALQRLSNKNAQKEYYLTDLVSVAARAEKRIDVFPWHSAEDLRGVNDQWELAVAGRILNERCVRSHAVRGVSFVAPWSTWVDVSVSIEEGVVVHPGAIIKGATRIERGAEIGPNVVLSNVEVGKGAKIRTGTVADGAKVGPGATVGPYAHLRAESVIGASAKIGNFVELKKTRIGEKTSVAHLSYLGDAEVGRNVNIGCGFVTCNFDGRVIAGERKHRTIIEDDVFLGSDCQAIAPVRIGRGAYVASGSTITEDVESDALAVARCRQVNKSGYARKLRAEGDPGSSGV